MATVAVDMTENKETHNRSALVEYKSKYSATEHVYLIKTIMYGKCFCNELQQHFIINIIINNLHLILCYYSSQAEVSSC